MWSLAYGGGELHVSSLLDEQRPQPVGRRRGLRGCPRHYPERSRDLGHGTDLFRPRRDQAPRDAGLPDPHARRAAPPPHGRGRPALDAHLADQLLRPTDDMNAPVERKSGVEGKSVSARVEHGVRGNMKKKKSYIKNYELLTT